MRQELIGFSRYRPIESPYVQPKLTDLSERRGRRVSIKQVTIAIENIDVIRSLRVTNKIYRLLVLYHAPFVNLFTNTIVKAPLDEYLRCL